MVANVILAFCCFLCGLPFCFLAVSSRKSKEPINFVSGDDNLKNKIFNVADYNKELGKVYLLYGAVWLVAAVVAFFKPIISVVIMILCCTVLLWLVYQKYKRILQKYGK